MMQIAINEARDDDNWYNLFNKDGNQGPSKFKLSSFSKINIYDLKLNDFVSNRHVKDNWSFWLLKLDIIPLVSCSFLTSSNISDDISISDNNGHTYFAYDDTPSFGETGICEMLSLHRYNHSIKIPNCKYQASLLFHLPDCYDSFMINYNDTPKSWYKPKIEHRNEIALLDAIKSSSWYSCKFKDSTDIDIRIQFIGFDLLPLSQAFEALKEDNPFYCGYYNLEDCEFKTLVIKAANYSKRDNNKVGDYLLDRLILLDNNGLYYAAIGSAGSFSIDFTSNISGSNVLSQPLTPKIVYNAPIVYLLAKDVSSLSIGLRYGTLDEI